MISKIFILFFAVLLISLLVILVYSTIAPRITKADKERIRLNLEKELADQEPPRAVRETVNKSSPNRYVPSSSSSDSGSFDSGSSD